MVKMIHQQAITKTLFNFNRKAAIMRLTATDFANHTRTELDLTGVKVILGHNGSGKTTIIDMIKYGFIGSARGYQAGTKGGHGASPLIRDGQKKAIVSIEHGDYKIIRSRTKTATALTLEHSGVPVGEGSKAQAAIYDAFGIDKSLLEVSMDSFEAINESPAKRKERLQPHLLTMSAAELEEKLVKSGVSGSLAPVIAAGIKDNGLIKTYDLAVIKKRAENGEVKTVTDIMKQDVPNVDDVRLVHDEVTYLSSSVTPEQLEKFTNLAKDLEESRTFKTRMLGAHDAYGRNIERINLVTLRNDMDTANDARDNADRVRDFAKTAYESAVTEMSEAAAKCQSCGQDVPWSEEDHQRMSKLKDTMDTTNSAYIEAARIAEDKKRQYESDKKLIDTKPEGDKDTLNSELSEIETQQGELMPFITAVHAHGEMLKVAKRHEDRILSAQLKAKEWESIVDILHPQNGKITAMVKKPLGELIEQVSLAAKSLSLNIVMHDDFSITCGDRHIEYCSASEKYRAGIALQAAISLLGGFPILPLDYGDILVNIERSRLMSFAAAMGKRFECVLLMISTHQHLKDVSAPEIEGIDFYWVDSGNIQSLADAQS